MNKSGKPEPANGGAGAANLEFADNALAQALFGSHHGHLALIEEKLPIVIRARGNVLNIAGPAEAVDAARKSLAALYKRLERGLSVERADVEAALRMAAESGQADFESLAVKTRSRHVMPRTPKQAEYLRAIDESELVFGQGPAGTGKTYLAVAKAVERLVKGEVDRIILSRPAVEAGEQLGFLPGSMREKVDPYLRPLYDALYDMLPAPQVVKRLESGEIEVAPLAFMRGRTLTNAFAILDEAQNTTAVQMKMFLTRLGEGSRMVVTGDLSQVDLPRGIRSGLRDAMETLKDVKGVSFVEFGQADVVRHPLVSRIVGAYDQVEKRRGAAARYEHESPPRRDGED
ncbi:MAG: phosphate starvation-inducible protein PhoH [Alphaproteobacteria bacterium]|nr:phosphate starvation-inducible protein PhoH [Alphaproteobacteria bacterium]